MDTTVAPSSASAEPVTEKPLSATAKAALMVSAAAMIGTFYLFTLVSMTALLALLAIEAVIWIALLRFGVSGWISPFIERQFGLLMIFARSFWLPRAAEFRLSLATADAPRLFAFVAQLAQRLHIAGPQKVYLEMTSGAWVQLRGLRRGAGTTHLGIGYDLLAGLSEAEVEAVLAHEMAHSKLVQRGLKSVLNAGLMRAGRLTGELITQVEAYRRNDRSFEVGEFFLRGADMCTRAAARLVATYSRQDEFEADRGAAELCGSAPLRSSLLKLEKLSEKTSRLGWHERVAQLQQGARFSAWLVAELSSADASASPGASRRRVHDRYSTHPTIPDRLAALPTDGSHVRPSEPAIRLLADPDAIASKLVDTIQRTLASEEQKDDRQLGRWLAKTRRGARLRPGQYPGAILAVASLICAILSVLDEFYLIGLPLSIVGFVAGCWLAKLARYRDRRSLPIPTFAAIKDSMEPTLEHAQLQTRENELEAELRAKASEAGSRHRQAALLLDESYAALRRCDYLHAHVAARLGIQTHKQTPEAVLPLAIASAGLQATEQAGSLLAYLRYETGLRSPAMVWGAAWTLLLCGDWNAAEALLRESSRQDPANSVFRILLALSQARRGKLQAAIHHAKQALRLCGDGAEETKFLIDLLLNGGHLPEAEDKLRAAEQAAPADDELTVSRLRLHLLQQDFERANACAQQLDSKAVPPHRCVRLGETYESARKDADAIRFYERALADEFFPDALLGLARIESHRRNADAARQHLLAALNTARPLGRRAASPLHVFMPVAEQLSLLEEPSAQCSAWIATITGNATAGPLAGHSFLVFAESEADAARHLKVVADAVRPGSPSLFPQYVYWKPAPKDRHPIGAVHPGIKSVWK